MTPPPSKPEPSLEPIQEHTGPAGRRRSQGPSTPGPSPGPVQGPARVTGMEPGYRGRIAPSPTGFLHVGHARTFWRAYQRSQAVQGTLVFREEDLDRSRCRPEFSAGMREDLFWLGIRWEEGPNVGGAFGPYRQSERLDLYRSVLDRLIAKGAVYPCSCSRKEVLASLSAPHAADEEPIYPGTCRPGSSPGRVRDDQRPVCWRFRVPDGEVIRFEDGGFGTQEYVAGRDFGDFVAWRTDGFPSYQLAVVVDDHAMRITEVVRGADLLVSTARQLLIYRALGWEAPRFYHCPLVLDEHGVRLAKRHAALSLRALRDRGIPPEEVRAGWDDQAGNRTAMVRA